jgi:hypothetical protein
MAGKRRQEIKAKRLSEERQNRGEEAEMNPASHPFNKLGHPADFDEQLASNLRFARLEDVISFGILQLCIDLRL